MNEEIKKSKKMLSTIGICAKARKLIYGIPLLCEAMKSGGKSTPILVLVANDISENSRKRITDRCKFYSVEYIILPIGAEEFGMTVGKKTALGAVGITDNNLCIAVKASINNNQ